MSKAPKIKMLTHREILFKLQVLDGAAAGCCCPPLLAMSLLALLLSLAMHLPMSDLISSGIGMHTFSRPVEPSTVERSHSAIS
jgi:hypothetical protein